MTQETEDKLASARRQALAQYASISEMVSKHRAADDDDTYEEMAPDLAKAAGFTVASAEHDGETVYYWHKAEAPAAFSEDAHTAHDTEEAAWLECCDDNGLRPDADEARREIEEDALSVQVRSGWYTPGETPEAEEFEILLCTGGPAVRIIGELGQHNEPDRARLQCQDWFTPWTDVIDGVDNDTLLEYARCFYFGE